MYGSDQTTADLRDESGFEGGWNIAETIIQILLGVIIVAGLSGALGDGVLARATWRQQDTSLHYERIARRSAASTLTVETVARADTLDIVLDDDLARTVTQTVPRAAATVSRDGAVSYSFPSSTGRTMHVGFDLKPAAAGFFDRHLTIDARPVTVRQLVLP